MRRSPIHATYRWQLVQATCFSAIVVAITRVEVADSFKKVAFSENHGGLAGFSRATCHAV